MKHEEYVNKTRQVTDFLTHVFGESYQCVATIVTAQADQDTTRLIDLLGLVKGRCEDWIKELKELEE